MWIPGENDEYIFEENLLPDFPLSTPAAFQIFESDCKLNYALMDQLSFKFFENPNTNAEEFINENLNMMLTPMAASVYSWSGTQGYHPLSKFKCMKVLIGTKHIHKANHSIELIFCSACLLYLLQNVPIRCVEYRQKMPPLLYATGSMI